MVLIKLIYHTVNSKFENAHHSFWAFNSVVRSNLAPRCRYHQVGSYYANEVHGGYKPDFNASLFISKVFYGVSFARKKCWKSIFMKNSTSLFHHFYEFRRRKINYDYFNEYLHCLLIGTLSLQSHSNYFCGAKKRFFYLFIWPFFNEWKRKKRRLSLETWHAEREFE